MPAKVDRAKAALTRAGKQRVWEAAYAIAYTSDFLALSRREGFDVAEEHTQGELACSVADAAVAELERWVKEGRL